MCKSWCEIILGIAVIVFALWTIPDVSNWVLVLIGAAIIIHSLTCKSCFNGEKRAAPRRRR